MFKIEEIKTQRQTSRSSRKPVIFIHPQGESILENLANRKDRPYTAYRKEVIPNVMKMLGIGGDVKVRWSQRAGCSCPCSPGFIVEGGESWKIGQKDIHVTVI